MELRTGQVAEGGDTLYMISDSSVVLEWLRLCLWKKGLVGSGFSSISSLGMTTSIAGRGFCDGRDVLERGLVAGLR